jgi:hypothetical protein
VGGLSFRIPLLNLMDSRSSLSGGFMVGRRSLPALCVMFALSLALSVARADQIDNPLYKAWSSYKVGSNKTLSSTMTVGPGIEVKMDLIVTLKTVADDHVTVETVSSSTVNGQSHQAPPRSADYPVKIDDKSLTDVGSDTVSAMGKKFDCKVLSLKSGAAGVASTGSAKVWLSDDVPGGVVQIQATATRPAGQTATITWTITAFEAK